MKRQVLELGEMSLKIDNICFFIFKVEGKQGMIENKNKKEAGSAIIKLKEIEEARSYNPTVFNCLNKNLMTWYKLIR